MSAVERVAEALRAELKSQAWVWEWDDGKSFTVDGDVNIYALAEAVVDGLELGEEVSKPVGLKVRYTTPWVSNPLEWS